MEIGTEIHFEVTELHIALLKRIKFQEGEGVPTVKPKRPYGNSDVLQDLRDIYAATMGYEVLRLRDEGTIVLQDDQVIARGDGTGTADEDIEAMLWKTHRQMSTVLQILADNLSIEEGVYSSYPYGGNWRLSEDR